ncbi:YicC/YloC family endoribonuclease [Oceaniradius stylonematis]|uniref:YicC/YloC family endoribonuclease n=1 Tax=Oceaniradius stylonematis TaxID=2184161 RepID=UPI003C7EABAE
MSEADIQSMTGFATAHRTIGTVRVNCDIRSVNGRSLDIKLRVPPGLEALEPGLKKRIAGRVARGNIQVSIGAEAPADAVPLAIDAGAFRHVAAQAMALSVETGLAPPTTDGVLQVRGVVLTEDGTASLAPDDSEEIGALVDAALDGLIAARRSEGAAMAALVAGHIAAIEALVDRAADEPESQPDAIGMRLSAQLERLLGDSTLDSERLNAEVALLAAKADVTEEIDRLKAHVAAARDHLAKGGPIGRKLDFLAQEFNREANTLCSKSVSSGLTAIGLDLKSVIDQLREQVQNLQ